MLVSPDLIKARRPLPAEGIIDNDILEKCIIAGAGTKIRLGFDTILFWERQARDWHSSADPITEVISYPD